MHAFVQRRKRKCPKRPQNLPTPFDLGWSAGVDRCALVERGGKPGKPRCPFKPGTPEEGEFARGMIAAARKFASESIYSCNNP